MLEQDNEFYVPYAYHVPTQPLAPAPVGVLDNPPATPAWPVQEASQPPQYPWGPSPPRSPPLKPGRRPGRTIAIALLTLVIAAIFGVGLFAGWEFAHNNNSTGTTSAATTSSASQAQSNTSSSSANTIETLQEAAIAKIEPAVVELAVTTSRGNQIGSCLIIHPNGDILSTNLVVTVERTITVVLTNATL